MSDTRFDLHRLEIPQDTYCSNFVIEAQRVGLSNMLYQPVGRPERPFDKSISDIFKSIHPALSSKSLRIVAIRDIYVQ